MSIKLDSYEQDIEDNFEKQQKIDDRSAIALLQKFAKAHLSKKRSVTIRIAEHDIEAIKIKASTHGLPYQTYLNMLIHSDTTKL
ncbi:CopG family antitoxin [Rickettsia peacockii]|uniref:CopG family antitoxin n=1 Tax=Rickettsia peacockii TaxID=47589 RepID=UPI0002D453DF|nr:CopG family antitoxin [Rickettsia peacockii]